MPSGHRSALGLRCRVGRCWTSATGRQHPRRQPRLPDWAVRSSVVTAAFPCHPAPSVCRPLFSPAGSVGAGRSPLGSCAISDGGGTRMCAGAGELPSQSPSGDSSPKGGAKYVRYQKLAQSQVSPPPLGEVSCLWHDGEGTPLARRPAFGKPPSRCAAVREKRFAVSLAFSHALRAYKGKVVGLWSHLPVRSAQGVCHRQTAPHTPQAF